jgi:hypothetical protein
MARLVASENIFSWSFSPDRKDFSGMAPTLPLHLLGEAALVCLDLIVRKRVGAFQRLAFNDDTSAIGEVGPDSIIHAKGGKRPFWQVDDDVPMSVGGRGTRMQSSVRRRGHGSYQVFILAMEAVR